MPKWILRILRTRLTYMIAVNFSSFEKNEAGCQVLNYVCRNKTHIDQDHREQWAWLWQGATLLAGCFSLANTSHSESVKTISLASPLGWFVDGRINWACSEINRRRKLAVPENFRLILNNTSAEWSKEAAASLERVTFQRMKPCFSKLPWILQLLRAFVPVHRPRAEIIRHESCPGGLNFYSTRTDDGDDIRTCGCKTWPSDNYIYELLKNSCLLADPKQHLHESEKTRRIVAAGSFSIQAIVKRHKSSTPCTK